MMGRDHLWRAGAVEHGHTSRSRACELDAPRRGPGRDERSDRMSPVKCGGGGQMVRDTSRQRQPTEEPGAQGARAAGYAQDRLP